MLNIRATHRVLWGSLILLTFTGAAYGVAMYPALPAPAHAAGRGPTVAGDWPLYGHDLQRTNFNPAETTINAGNVASLVSHWQAPIGIGDYPSSSSPVIADGRVFIGSSVPSGPNYFAFDAQTGARLWQANLGYESVPDCPPNVGIGSTAAISGTILAVGGGDMAYYGLNAATGAQLWRNPMGAGASSFAWASPLLANGRAYIGIASYCDNPSVRGELRALDLQTGVQVANQYFVPSNTGGAGIWNSPALSPSGQTLVVATGEDYFYDGLYNRAMVSLDPLSLAITGADKQGLPYHDHDWGTTPIIFQDRLGRTLVGAPNKNGTFYAYLLSNISAGPVWQRVTDVGVGAMPAYDPTFGPGGTLFIIGNRQILAVDPATGADRWPPVTTYELFGNIAVANGLIYANLGQGGIEVLDETTGNLLTYLIPANAGDTFTGVTVAHGLVYWTAGGYLNAWGLPTGGTPVPTVPGTPPRATTTPAATSTPGGPTATPIPSCVPGWNVVNSPNPGVGDNRLQGLAVIGPGDIWAVGATHPVSASQTLIEHWNGTAWSVVPSPSAGSGENSLHAVAAAGPDDVWAVGVSHTGMIAQTLTEHWDGSAWSIVPSPNAGSGDNTLLGVAAFAPGDIWAVGASQTGGLSQTLIEHWDGSTWSIVASPNDPNGSGTLQAISIYGGNDIWAVGYSDKTLVEHWDGTQWSVMPSPNPGPGVNALLAVAAVATDDVWAVGYYRTGFGSTPLTEHWDGTAWSVVASPNPGATTWFNEFESVTALAGNDVWAVGFYSLGGANGGLEQTLAEHWNGNTWSVVPSTNSGAGNNGLAAVAAVGPVEVWAVGSAADTGPTRTLAERYPSPCSPAVCPIQFSDVPAGSPFYAYVRCLACRGIVSGYGDNTFRPGSLVTRGQFAKFVANAAGFSDAIPATRQSFTDVPPSHPFWLYIEQSYAHGVISGYANGDGTYSFRPNNTVTRSQAAKLVANAAGYTETIAPNQQTFADVPPGNPFWLYVERVYLHSVISGYTCGQPPAGACDSQHRPYFLPGASITRGQTAKIISNAFFPGCSTPLVSR